MNKKTKEAIGLGCHAMILAIRNFGTMSAPMDVTRIIPEPSEGIRVVN